MHSTGGYQIKGKINVKCLSKGLNQLNSLIVPRQILRVSLVWRFDEDERGKQCRADHIQK